MKVIHLSSSIIGGAGIAAVRYHNLSKILGYQSILYHNSNVVSEDEDIISVASKKKGDGIKNIVKKILPRKIINTVQRINSSYSPRNIYCFYNYNECITTGLRPDLIDKIDLKDVDIIFVHWMGGFLNTYDIKRLYEMTKARIIFSMMDMEPITGGCHYFWNCKGYKENCFNCPALPYDMQGLSHKQLQVRSINTTYINPEIFSSSLYDIQAAKESAVYYKNYWQCYYPIDDNIFKPQERNNNVKYIFSNSNSINDSRKGFWLVLKMLFLLDRKLTYPVKFLCLTDECFKGYRFNNIEFETFEFCSNVNDLAKIYQRADVFVCSSVEDAAPMMLAEALLCGLPTVAFDCATAKQFIENGKDGYVVDRYDVYAMAEKVHLLLADNKQELRTPDEIHQKMKRLYGIEAVSKTFKKIVEG